MESYNDDQVIMEENAALLASHASEDNGEAIPLVIFNEEKRRKYQSLLSV
jgi:hypothetical protein